MKKLVLAAVAALVFAGAGALSATPAHASYAFPGVSVIDTEQNCPHTNNGQPKCYTWIRSNGVLRRGSPTEYFSEASGGFVAVLCSSAKWHPAANGDLYNYDYDFSRVTGSHFHWVIVTNNGYCWSPSASNYPWNGTPWPAVPNRKPL